MENIKFSILIPVYNVEDYLDACMQSVLNQTYTNYEVILTDDGSTDSSGKICDSYAQENIVTVHQENRGLMVARRVGIAYASGDYCVFLDSDDLLAENALRCIADEIERTNADMVLYNAYLFNDGDLAHAWKRKPLFEENRLVFSENKDAIYRKLLFSTEANNLVIKAIKTELLKNDPTDYRPYYSNPNGEDAIQSFVPVDTAKKIAYINEYLYYYRQRANSISKNITTDNLERQFAKFNNTVFCKKMEYIHKWGMADSQNMSIICNAFLSYFVSFFFDTLLSCGDKKSKEKWIGMDWPSLLPQEVTEALQQHRAGLSKVVLIQTKAILSKNRCGIALFEILRRIKDKLT